MISRRRPRRNGNQLAQRQEADQDFQHAYEPNAEETYRHEQVRTRSTRKAKINYAMEQEKPEPIPTYDYIEEPIQQVVNLDFLAPKVEFILWKIDHQNIEQQRYLVKYLGRSYVQVQWLTRAELSDIGFEITSNVLRSIKIKMRKTLQLKLGEQAYFNPNYLIPDRILTSTEIFTAIHHKRAHDIKGKWDESIMLVCQKILNFVKNGYPYGVILHEPYNEELQNQKGITNRINIGQVLNKVYLGYYKNQWFFWLELGMAIKNYLLIYGEDRGDYHIVGQTIKECSIFLYEQWYVLSKQRYKHLANELSEKGIVSQKIIQESIEVKTQRYFTNYNQGQQWKEQQQERIKEQAEQEIKEQSVPEQGEINKQANAMQGQERSEARQKNGNENQENNGLKIQQKPKEQEHIKNEYKIDIQESLCKTNIFMTQKSVDNPRNTQELQLLNPMIFTYEWLTSTQQDTKYTKYTFKHLNQQDLKLLDLNTQVDKLYFVKWRDLSYKESTWESQKNISSIEKIEEFKQWNKIPVREVREKIEMHNKIHKFLMEYSEIMSEKKGQGKSPNIQKMESKLYLLDAGEKGKPKEYLGKDIPIYKNYRKLKDFQLQSLNWLIKSWYENRNTILADEMGLGKTIQTISFLFHLHAHEGVLGPFLVLAPLTTLHQWRRQIQEWTTFNCLLYYDEGTSQIREMIQEYEFYHMHTTKSGDIIPSKIPKFQILLTNYELFINDFQILKKIPYQHIVLDQAHRLKNKNAKTTVILNKLPCCRRTLLTGTPIQNNTKELWTLLNFIQPKEFALEEVFLSEYGNLSTEEHVKDFKKMLKPYILRRVKEDVQTTIPRLSQTIIDVEMSSQQKTYYRGIYQKNKTSMIKSLSAANFNSLSMQLRKCCNHPFLISPETQAEIKQGAQNEWQEMQRFISASGKMLLLMKLLEKFKNQGKKVLIFSQFVMMLDLMKPYLELKGYNCQILKGSLSSTQRFQAISRFNNESTDIFLISTKAGGVGINLVAATEIVIYDSDWNPQNDIQATARAHRIGQKKQVTVYRFITANSYESQMYQMSSKKLGLDKAIFTGDTFKSMGEFDDSEKQLTKNEIQMLLKKGIVGFLQSKVDQQQFFNQSIEDILSKNARKVEYSVSVNSCNTFSKTKFKSEETNDININAPDFWEQALKGMETPVDKLVKKRKELKEYSTIQKQEELMLEAYKIVLNFVKQKTLGTGFNAQDERNLLKFLQAITSERSFNRHFRDIADQLSLQIQKPSRRFKVKQEDIMIANGNNQINSVQPHKKEHNDKRESSRLKKLKKVKDNFGLDDGKMEEDDISDVSQQQGDDSPTPEEDDKAGQEERAKEQFEKTCYLCQKPKCLIFCKGICGRPFHKKCFDLFNTQNHKKLDCFQLQEFGMQYQQWKESKSYEQKCINCKESNFIFKCSVCLEMGLYVQDQSTNLKKKKSTRLRKQSKQGDENTLYKCSHGKCNKFYHLHCLYAKDFQGKFSDHMGKTIKEVSTISKTFRCPSHYCNSCYGTDVKSTKLKSYNCIRCCLSFHDKCVDKDHFFRLGSEHYYVCKKHLQKNQSIENMVIEMTKFKPSKRDRISQKKKIKEGKSKKDKKETTQNKHAQMQEQKQQNLNAGVKDQQRNFLPQKNEMINEEEVKGASKQDKKSLQQVFPNINNLKVQDKSLQKSEKSKQKQKKSREEQARNLRRSKRFKKEDNEYSQSEVEKNSLQKKTQSREQMKMSTQQDKQSKEKTNKKKKTKSKNKSLQSSTSKSKKQKRHNKSISQGSNKQSSKSEMDNQSQKSKNTTINSSIFSTFKYQYADFKLTPIYQFDFSQYKNHWCRFCGARYAKSFQLSPWGNHKLCSHHYQQFKKGKLKLDKYKNQPKVPINKSKENEIRFLNEYAKTNKITPSECLTRLNEDSNMKG